MHHRIKIDKAFFDAIEDGIKLFELRENDRDYRIGDTAELMETKYTAMEMYRGAPCELTGRDIAVVITFVLRGNKGSMLREDACIFSFHVLGDIGIAEITKSLNEAKKNYVPK